MPTRPRLLRLIGTVLVVVMACGILTWVLVARATVDEPASRPATPSLDLAVASPEKVRAALADGASPIDVRTEQEFADGHLEGARNIDVDADEFERKIAALDPESKYVVYCASGRRAALAIKRMKRVGFTDLLNAGGYDDLARDGFATARG